MATRAKDDNIIDPEDHEDGACGTSAQRYGRADGISTRPAPT
jgi:hypothetical protein